jgi:hypothetical protein
MKRHGDVMVRLSARLGDALRNYSIIERDVAATGTRLDESSKLALVRARRQLSERIGELGPAIEQDEELAGEPDRQRELSRLFAAMRYALALHQANWPVVKISEDPAAYRASATGVQEKSGAFWDWCRVHLGIQKDDAGA